MSGHPEDARTLLSAYNHLFYSEHLFESRQDMHT